MHCSRLSVSDHVEDPRRRTVARVLPTGGEIPTVQGLALAGLSPSAAGALLVTAGGLLGAGLIVLL